uniref:DOMON domain-containing protein n=1 Tax=Thelazia callipaeda TaxID=103827 RepID=A0A0N5D296_THECL
LFVELCKENEEFSNCPEFNRQCEASCDWTEFPETIPNCPRTCGTPKCVCKEGFVRLSSDNDTCVQFHFCSAECGVACEPTCENMYDTSPCPATCNEPACTCADNYVRYQEKCIFWGDCPNLEQRFASNISPSSIVKDGIVGTVPLHVKNNADTRDSDSLNGSESITTETPSIINEIEKIVDNSLTCGINETINECGRACEPNCNNIYSREKCTECWQPSCACIHGYTRTKDRCVYWGDCPPESRRGANNRQHITQSVQAVPKTSTISIAESIDALDSTNFVALQNGSKTSESKYSNSKAAQSTVKNSTNIKSQNLSTTVPTLRSETDVSGDVCYGDWRWPPGCRDCDYRISWNYLDDTDEIEFSVETHAPSNWWTGVGFSPTGTMVEADLIIVKSKNGQLSLHDMYSTGNGVPREDSKQDVYTPTVIGTHVNGVLRAQFTRKRDTGDRKADHHFSETNCYKFLFPVSGGRLEPNGQISRHIATPEVSKNKICIQSCTAPQDLQPTSSCEMEYRYPTGCEGPTCDYVAKWEYNIARKDVKFEISSKELGRWTGIGFSRDGQMANSDIYIGWVFEGKAYVTDRFAYGRQLPAIDPADRQDIYEISGKEEDDVQTITFRRKVLPADTITDFPLNKCYYYLFPIGGGRVLARKSEDFRNAKTPIGYHDLYQPKVSRTKICICDQNGVSIAFDDAPPAVRNRRQTSEMDIPFRHKLHLQDPFEVQIDPFAGFDKESELDFPIDEKKIKLKNEAVPDHLPLEIKKLATAAEITLSTSSSIADQSAVQKSTAWLLNSTSNSSNADLLESKLHLKPEPSSGFGPVVSNLPTIPEAELGPSIIFTSPEPETNPQQSKSVSESKNGNFRIKRCSNIQVLCNHPLDCVDVVIGSVINGMSRVRDYYSVSHARPQLDEFFGGQNSLTSASAYYHNGITTVVFRKPLEAFDNADQAITSGETTVIWAKGMKELNFVSSAEDVIFRDDITKMVDFYLEDNFDQKEIIDKDGYGLFVTNFFVNCTAANCDYKVHWSTKGKTITFSLSAKIPTDHWTGIGFSHDGSMVRADVIVISVLDEKTIKVLDMYFSDYNRPTVDTEQDLFDIQTSYDNGHVYANFSRYLVSTDDNDISVDHCVYFIYLINSGELDKDTKAVHEHAEMPVSSRKKICPMACVHNLASKKTAQHDIILNSSVLPEESITAKSVAYDVVLRIWNREWNPAYMSRNTREFHELAAEVNAMVKTKFPQMRVVEIQKFSKGSVLVFMTLFSEDKPLPSEHELKEYLNKQSALQTSESLQFEATSIVQKKTEKETSIKADQIRNWIVLGIGVSLFLIATFLACCIISRSRKVQSVHCRIYDLVAVLPIDAKKNPGGGFENAAYQSTHSRQFSQATTASQNGTNKGSPNVLEDSPKGVGETTYQEWFSKVASKPGVQQHEETSFPSPSLRSPISRQSFSGPSYVSHAQDVANTFYGDVRLAAPGYYRPY